VGVIITDPTLPDNPIIYVNKGFTLLTGYFPDEVIGCNCRFLQGPNSNPDSIALIRELLPLKQSFDAGLLNYRKNGTSFWNQVTIIPVLDEQGELIYYIGIQNDITERKMTEIMLSGKSAVQTLLSCHQKLHHANRDGLPSSYESWEESSADDKQKVLEFDIYKGLTQGQFVSYYQPLIDLRTSSIIGMEALLRWHHPRFGIVLPGHIIPLAEELGLIIPIGEWMLWEACRQNKVWQDAGYPHFTVAVNISAIQFQQDDFVQIVAKALKDTGLAPECLELEITENISMLHNDFVVAHLSELQALGVKIAIDDFGTGHSALNYLKHFPVHTLKIDKSFIDGIPWNEKDVAITTKIIEMAHSLQLRVIAEGVETEDQLDFLKQYGCDVAQGYLFCKPVPVDDINKMLKNLAANKWRNIE
jgi:PAS domain S-box-containing protein